MRRNKITKKITKILNLKIINLNNKIMDKITMKNWQIHNHIVRL